MEPLPRASLLKPDRASTAAWMSLGFTLDQISNGLTGLRTLDALLVLAINQANIAPLTRDPAARSAYGSLSAPAPDEQRRPVSVHAIATSLQLPFETTRRHVRRLEDLGVCATQARGVIVPESYLASPAYQRDVITAHDRMRRLYLDLREARLIDPLPKSDYPVEPEGAPIRAAARLLSDFLLRSTEAMGRLTPDILSSFVLMAIAVASLEPGGGRSITIAGIARRLAIPGETVRRRAGALAEQSLCVRGPRGFYVPHGWFADPAWHTLIEETSANVGRLMAALSERGVIDAWNRLEALPGPNSQKA